MVEEVLLSPTLSAVLCGKQDNFRIGEGTTVAKLDRAILAREEALVLGALLIGQHKGQVIVPDFGFYGRPLHVSLMRQERLTAGLNFLDEVPRQLVQALLTIPDKYGRGCTFDDAQVLGGYTGLVAGTTAHTDFVQRTIEQGP